MRDASRCVVTCLVDDGGANGANNILHNSGGNKPSRIKEHFYDVRMNAGHAHGKFSVYL